MLRQQYRYTQDSIRRCLFFYQMYMIRLLHFIIKTSYIPSMAHVFIYYMRSRFYFYRPKARNRCLYLSRARHVHRRWGLSKFYLRHALNVGLVTHVTHARW